MKGRPRAGAQRRRELIDLLKRLSHPGAMLVEMGQADDRRPDTRLAILMPDDSGGMIATVERDVLETALARGWVQLSSGATRPVVTRAGRELLRRARSEQVLERAATGQVPLTQVAGGMPLKQAMECPLGWLAGRNDPSGRPMIEPEELAAGERLRADLTFAGLGPRMTMSWSGMPGEHGAARASGNGHDMSDSVLAARQRVASALHKVGPEFSGLLIDVCGHYRTLADIAASEGWPQRATRLLLKQALRSLARHYGILSEVPVEQTIAARLRHWGGEGYRPTLSRSPPVSESEA